MITEDEIKSFLSKIDNDKNVIKKVSFPPLRHSKGVGQVKTCLEHLQDVPVTISAELGQSTLKVKDILNLTEGSVIEINKLAGEAIDVFVNGQKFSLAEVVVVNDVFGLRIISIYPPGS
jgi:flagellar motor switch protein FliN/FliY